MDGSRFGKTDGCCNDRRRMSSPVERTPRHLGGLLSDSHQKLRAVQNAAHVQLDGALQHMFDAVRATLDAAPLGEAIDGLRAVLKRHALVARLTHEHIERCWVDFAIGIAGAEVDLAPDAMRIASRSREQHASALDRLERRLALLQPGGTEAAANHPLVPSHLLHAFITAMQACSIGESSSRSLAQEYERTVLARLGDISDSLSRLLVEQDVLADEPVPTADAAAQATARESSKPEAAGDEGKAPGTAAAAAESAQRDASPQHALAVLQRLVGKAVLPRFVTELLYGPLMRYLAQAHRREGESGGAWREGCGFASALIWSAQTHSNAEDRPRVDKTASELVATLPRLLNRLAMSETEITAMQARLQQFYETILREPASIGETIAAASTKDAQVADEGSTAREGGEEPIGATDDLRVGSWVMLHLGDAPVRAKLSWISANGGSFLFVDARGAKLALLTHAKLEGALVRSR